MAVPNRSHFAAMELLEDADPGTIGRQGWVNRIIGLDGSDSPLQAVQMGTSYPSTRSPGPHRPWPRPASATSRSPGPPGTSSWLRAPPTAAGDLLGSASGPLGAAGRRRSGSPTSRPGSRGPAATTVTYPQDTYGKDLGEALADSARLIKADVGAR